MPKSATILLIILSAVCANAEWTFDNDKEVQERGDKRDEEREEARKALERVRFGVKVGSGLGWGVFGDEIVAFRADIGIMINTPLSRLKNGNLVLATELNFGFAEVDNWDMDLTKYTYSESHLNIPLMLQYVSFFYPTSDIQVHWVPSPKRHVFMHLKTIAEAGAFIDIPFGTTIRIDSHNDNNGNYVSWVERDYKDRNFFDLGGMVGYAAQLENIILGLRLAASYVDFGGSSLLLQGKMYLGYLF
jgi:hypothetical protein